MRRQCVEPGCEDLNRARGFCLKHYYRHKRRGTLSSAPYRTLKPISEKFWEKTPALDPNTCWEWLSSRDKKGYGTFRHDGKALKAHRVSWEIANGQPVPDGLMILHSCDNPPCVNPAHLRAGTAKDNAADAIARERFVGSSLTHCKRGHEFTPENTARHTQGWRVCIACRRLPKAARAS